MVVYRRELPEQPTEPQELTLNQIYQIAHDRYKANPNDVVAYVYEQWGEKNGVSKELVMTNYEIWLRNNTSKPNFERELPS
jgi:hypothetical protein